MYFVCARVISVHVFAVVYTRIVAYMEEGGFCLHYVMLYLCQYVIRSYFQFADGLYNVLHTYVRVYMRTHTPERERERNIGIQTGTVKINQYRTCLYMKQYLQR